jgi:hypothetical protein
MKIKDLIFSLFSKAPSKRRDEDIDGDFFLDKRPPD